MSRSSIVRGFVLAIVLGCTATMTGLWGAEYVSGKVWPEPKVIDPGDASRAPSDAIALFDGKDLSKWVDGDKWIVKDGVATAAGASINTKQGFGSCQLHLEFATPAKVEGHGQGRGNSGIFFMSAYELQILDSYDNTTYFDGQCGSIYKEFPPLVNASRKPGEWQTYDVVFMAPKFDAQGKLLKPAYMTVLHNGVLVQNHAKLLGSTFWHKPPAYEAHAAKMPMQLQYHLNPVRFRNIWIRELKD